MKSLKDYVKVYSCLDKQLCSNIVDELKTVSWEEHTFYNPNTETVIKHKREPFSYYKKTSMTNQIMQNLSDCLNEYCYKEINEPKYLVWNGFSYPKYNKYVVDTEMSPHCDHIHSLFSGEVRGIPILSMICSLNNDYEGGEFLLFDSVEYKISAGQVIIFPSVFLYPHRVLPVTRGERYSFACWSW